MDDREDEIKVLRLEQENKFIDIDFVETMASKVTDELLEWTNSNVFRPLGGCLSLKIVTFGEPNARAITHLKSPYSPTIEIRLAMFQEIYRDAFTFPLISKRIEAETNTIDQFHNSLYMPYDERYMFSTGVPIIPSQSTRGILRTYHQAMLHAYKEKPNIYINENDIACRFVMFECVIAWVFFHELGHLVQKHYMFKKDSDSCVESEVVEIDESREKLGQNLDAQAREMSNSVEKFPVKSVE